MKNEIMKKTYQKLGVIFHVIRDNAGFVSVAIESGCLSTGGIPVTQIMSEDIFDLFAFILKTLHENSTGIDELKCKNEKLLSMKRGLERSLEILKHKVANPTQYPDDSWDYNKGAKSTTQYILDDLIFENLEE